MLIEDVFIVRNASIMQKKSGFCFGIHYLNLCLRTNLKSFKINRHLITNEKFTSFPQKNDNSC